MNWTRSDTLALASQSCTHCWGLGLRPGRGGRDTPCHCVLRAIFRACFARFRQCSTKEKYLSRVSLEANPGRQRKSVWGMKNEEYLADFCLIAERTLEAGTLAHKLFKFHFLLGADWKLCTKKLGLNRGDFFHEVYRVEARLGRAFRETAPFALFPLDEYFTTSISRARPASPGVSFAAHEREARGRTDRARLRPPLAKAAA
jgi:hypothetical protein